MSNFNLPSLIERLTKIASEDHPADYDEFIPYEFYGGNCDDIFSSGQRLGNRDMACQVLRDLGVWRG